MLLFTHIKCTLCCFFFSLSLSLPFSVSCACLSHVRQRQAVSQLPSLLPRGMHKSNCESSLQKQIEKQASSLRRRKREESESQRKSDTRPKKMGISRMRMHMQVTEAATDDSNCGRMWIQIQKEFERKGNLLHIFFLPARFSSLAASSPQNHNSYGSLYCDNCHWHEWTLKYRIIKHSDASGVFHLRSMKPGDLFIVSTGNANDAQ